MHNVFRGIVAAGMVAASMGANAVPVDAELSLVIDVSPSVDSAEFALVMGGYRAAFEDGSVQAAISALPGGLAVNVVFFSFNAVEKIGWTLLTDAASSSAFGALFSGLSRVPPTNSGTDLAEGYNFGIDSIIRNDYEGARLIIDISGDGPQNLNNGCPAFGDGTAPSCVAQTNAARSRAEQNGIRVNGVVIAPDDPLFGPGGGLKYYQDYIVTSSGFVVAAADFTDFADAVRGKIFREIVGVPEPGALSLLGIGLVGLGLSRRRRAA